MFFLFKFICVSFTLHKQFCFSSTVYFFLLAGEYWGQYNSLVITEHHPQPAVVFSEALYERHIYVTDPGLPAPVGLQKD